MGFLSSIFSRRVGSDPYYLSYEKSFEKIATSEQLIQERGAKRRQWMQDLSSRSIVYSIVWAIVMAAGWAWINRERWIVPYSRTWFICVGVSVGVLQLLVFLALFLRKVLGMLERRDGVYLKRLQESRKKMLKELKDSTHFEKTMALLRKYDPEARPPPPPPQQRQGTPRGSNGALTPTMGGPGQPMLTPNSHLLMRTGNAVVAGAGKALFPMFDTLANTMIGDNPQLVDELRRAQHEVDHLRQENESLKRKVASLQGGGASAGGELLALAGPPSPDILPDNSTSSMTGSEGGRGKDGLPKVSQEQAEGQDLEPGQSRSGDQSRAGTAGGMDAGGLTFQPAGAGKSQLRARKGTVAAN